jgi:hypothetical protein
MPRFTLKPLLRIWRAHLIQDSLELTPFNDALIRKQGCKLQDDILVFAYDFSGSLLSV